MPLDDIFIPMHTIYLHVSIAILCLCSCIVNLYNFIINLCYWIVDSYSPLLPSIAFYFLLLYSISLVPFLLPPILKLKQKFSSPFVMQEYERPLDKNTEQPKPMESVSYKLLEKLQNSTRNLEQEYAKWKISQLAGTIEELKKTLKEAQAKRVSNEPNSKVADLESKITKLEKESESKELLEKALNTERERVKELDMKLEKMKNKTDGEYVSENQNNKKNEFEKLDLEKCVRDIKESQIETKSILKQLAKSLEGGEDSYLRKKIADLEEKLEDLRSKNLQLLKNDKNFKEQKDSVALLKEALETKEKIIQSQKLAIEKLNEQLKAANRIQDPFGGDVVVGSKNEMSGALPWSVNQPQIPVPKKKGATKKVQNAAEQPPEKKVNVENIFRDENKSFFNNLSFTNSSPVVTKKFKQNFK